MIATPTTAGLQGLNPCNMPSNLRVEELPGYNQAVARAVQTVSKTDLTKLVIPTLFAEHDKVLLDVEAVTMLLNSAHDFGVATGRRVQQLLSRDNT